MFFEKLSIQRPPPVAWRSPAPPRRCAVRACGAGSRAERGRRCRRRWRRWRRRRRAGAMGHGGTRRCWRDRFHVKNVGTMGKKWGGNQKGTYIYKIIWTYWVPKKDAQQIPKVFLRWYLYYGRLMSMWHVYSPIWSCGLSENGGFIWIYPPIGGLAMRKWFKFQVSIDDVMCHGPEKYGHLRFLNYPPVHKQMWKLSNRVGRTHQGFQQALHRSHGGATSASWRSKTPKCWWRWRRVAKQMGLPWCFFSKTKGASTNEMSNINRKKEHKLRI